MTILIGENQAWQLVETKRDIVAGGVEEVTEWEVRRHDTIIATFHAPISVWPLPFMTIGTGELKALLEELIKDANLWDDSRNDKDERD